MIDTHCHLQVKEFDSDRDAVIARAKRKGVTKMIVPGIDHASSQDAINLAKTYPLIIFPAVGIHPYAVTTSDGLHHVQEKISITGTLAEASEVVAIGEIGLDYRRFHSNAIKHAQRELLTSQLDLAERLNLPVIIHCRDAWDDILEILSPRSIRGVLHCFSGGLHHLQIALSLGFSIGVDGNCTYSQSLPTIIQEIPLDRLLLETDSPYLTPLPYRGKRNEPSHLPFVAQKVAKIKGIDRRTVEEQTIQNARSLFRNL